MCVQNMSLSRSGQRQKLDKKIYDVIFAGSFWTRFAKYRPAYKNCNFWSFLFNIRVEQHQYSQSDIQVLTDFFSRNSNVIYNCKNRCNYLLQSLERSVHYKIKTTLYKKIKNTNTSRSCEVTFFAVTWIF